MNEFTPKQRLLAAILGKETDYVPFSPFLAYYFESLPEEVRARGDRDYILHSRDCITRSDDIPSKLQ